MADARQGRKKDPVKKRGPKTVTGTGKTVKADLRRAVKDEVSKRSKELAAALVSKAVAGNPGSVNLVWKVLEEQIKEEEKSAEEQAVPQGPSLAERLATEEEWHEEGEAEEASSDFF